MKDFMSFLEKILWGIEEKIVHLGMDGALHSLTSRLSQLR